MFYNSQLSDLTMFLTSLSLNFFFLYKMETMVCTLQSGIKSNNICKVLIKVCSNNFIIIIKMIISTIPHPICNLIFFLVIFFLLYSSCEIIVC